MLPDIEVTSAKVHEAWMNSKLAQGVTTRKAEDGEELMVPYDQLTEKAKELDRGTVRAVYRAIESLTAAPSTLPLSAERVRVVLNKLQCNDLEGIAVCAQALLAIELEQQVANEQARSRTLVNAAVFATERAEKAEAEVAELRRAKS